MNTRLIAESISLRLVVPEDVELLKYFFESISESTRVIFPGFPFTDDHAEKLANEAVADPGVRRFILIEHNSHSTEEAKVLAMVWFWEWTKQVPWFGIMIADAYQNRGYGRKLLEFTIKDAREFKKGGILLTTHKTNIRAQKLYLQYDFQTIGEDSRGEHLMILNFLDENGLAAKQEG